MRLFRERGYGKTTMRAIAAEAGVSVGNAYYYFESKELLIQGFYDRVPYEHAAIAKDRLAGRQDFAERLEIAVAAWLDCAADYHNLSRYRMFRPLLRDAKGLIQDFVLPVIGRSQRIWRSICDSCRSPYIE
jgi:AcrR family transcriptional regulator